MNDFRILARTAQQWDILSIIVDGIKIAVRMSRQSERAEEAVPEAAQHINKRN